MNNNRTFADIKAPQTRKIEELLKATLQSNLKKTTYYIQLYVRTITNLQNDTNKITTHMCDITTHCMQLIHNIIKNIMY